MKSIVAFALSAVVVLSAPSARAEGSQGSRWIALLPFGVGQLQNGDVGRGVFFAVGEGLVAGTMIGSYAYQQRLASMTPSTSQIASLNARLETAAIVNRCAFAGLVTLAAIGVVDAELRFPGPRSAPAHVVVSGAAGPGSGSMTLRATF